MTPQEHLAQAERLLEEALDYDVAAIDADRLAGVLGALAHAVIASAAESGVPHPAAPQEAATSAR